MWESPNLTSPMRLTNWLKVSWKKFLSQRKHNWMHCILPWLQFMALTICWHGTALISTTLSFAQKLRLFVDCRATNLPSFVLHRNYCKVWLCGETPLLKNFTKFVKTTRGNLTLISMQSAKIFRKSRGKVVGRLFLFHRVGRRCRKHCIEKSRHRLAQRASSAIFPFRITAPPINSHPSR